MYTHAYALGADCYFCSSGTMGAAVCAEQLEEHCCADNDGPTAVTIVAAKTFDDRPPPASRRNDRYSLPPATADRSEGSSYIVVMHNITPHTMIVDIR